MKHTEPLQRLNKNILKSVNKICKKLRSPRVHCQIEGFPIKKIVKLEDGRTQLEGMVRYISCKVIVSKSFMKIHNPSIGGYFIRYPNNDYDYLSASKFNEEFEEYIEGNLGF